jgi:hypothetical protein
LTEVDGVREREEIGMVVVVLLVVVVLVLMARLQ